MVEYWHVHQLATLSRACHVLSKRWQYFTNLKGEAKAIQLQELSVQIFVSAIDCVVVGAC